jgi:hypothetical protein
MLTMMMMMMLVMMMMIAVTIQMAIARIPFEMCDKLTLSRQLAESLQSSEVMIITPSYCSSYSDVVDSIVSAFKVMMMMMMMMMIIIMIMLIKIIMMMTTLILRTSYDYRNLGKPIPYSIIEIFKERI